MTITGGAEALRFDDATTASRHTRLRTWAAAATSGWRHAPVSRGGSTVVEAWWSDPRGSAPTLSALVHDRPVGARWLAVGTSAFGDRFPEVFGVTWRAGALDAHLPAELAVSLRGGKVSGSHFALTFPARGDEPAVVISDRRDTRVHDALAVWTLPTFDRDEEGLAIAVEDALERLLASPASLRAAAGEWDQAARAAALQLIDEGRAYRCRYDAAKSVRGVPPPCEPIPLTEAEQAAARASIDEGGAAVAARLDREHAAMYQVLGHLLPAAAWSR